MRTPEKTPVRYEEAEFYESSTESEPEIEEGYAEDFGYNQTRADRNSGVLPSQVVNAKSSYARSSPAEPSPSGFLFGSQGSRVSSPSKSAKPGFLENAKKFLFGEHGFGEKQQQAGAAGGSARGRAGVGLGRAAANAPGAGAARAPGAAASVRAAAGAHRRGSGGGGGAFDFGGPTAGGLGDLLRGGRPALVDQLADQAVAELGLEFRGGGYAVPPRGAGGKKKAGGRGAPEEEEERGLTVATALQLMWLVEGAPGALKELAQGHRLPVEKVREHFLAHPHLVAVLSLALLEAPPPARPVVVATLDALAREASADPQALAEMAKRGAAAGLLRLAGAARAAPQPLRAKAAEVLGHFLHMHQEPSQKVVKDCLARLVGRLAQGARRPRVAERAAEAIAGLVAAAAAAPAARGLPRLLVGEGAPAALAAAALALAAAADNQKERRDGGGGGGGGHHLHLHLHLPGGGGDGGGRAPAAAAAAAREACVRAARALARVLQDDQDLEWAKKFRQQTASAWTKTVVNPDGKPVAVAEAGREQQEVALYQKRQVWWEEGNTFVTLSLSQADLKHIRQQGVAGWAERRGITLKRFSEKQIHYCAQQPTN